MEDPFLNKYFLMLTQNYSFRLEKSMSSKDLSDYIKTKRVKNYRNLILKLSISSVWIILCNCFYSLLYCNFLHTVTLLLFNYCSQDAHIELDFPINPTLAMPTSKLLWLAVLKHEAAWKIVQMLSYCTPIIYSKRNC